MKIIVDIMSGDNAPLEQLRGAVRAAHDFRKTDFIFVGNVSVIESTAAEEGLELDLPNIEMANADDVLTMEDEPLSIIREKRDSSMAIGLKLLSGGRGDAFLSAGNTGALHAGSTLIVRRIKGVKKSAIATVLPFANPTLLIDSGANTEIDAATYVQFAQMGSIYAKKILGAENPRVGLINIGAEKTKGTAVVREAYDLLGSAEGINFIGNVEGKELPYGACDVLVCDGFTGNIVLKLTEGCGSYITSKLKDVFGKNVLTKASALGVRNGLKQMIKDFDATEYGGAPLLGLAKTVIKAHGGSNADAFFNAVRQSISCVENNINYEIAELLVPKKLPPEDENNEN